MYLNLENFSVRMYAHKIICNLNLKSKRQPLFRSISAIQKTQIILKYENANKIFKKSSIGLTLAN